MRASRLLAAPVLAAVALAGCNCQRTENVAAKARLSQPPPPDPAKERAKEVLRADTLASDEAARDRVMRMSARELAARLQSFKLKTEGRLEFSRAEVKMRSKERVELVQGPEGHFSIHVVTGDESEQRVAYINDILFLKNNNGRWRASRDPVGEREELLEDSAGIWRSFYDLFAHALALEPAGDKRHGGRNAARYVLTLPDQTAAAKALGASEPPAIAETTTDGGVADEDQKAAHERVTRRLKRWREKARPAGGRGEALVDKETGALLYVRFDGALAVGDSREPGRLKVKLTHSLTEVGKDHEIPAPKDAIEEIVRKKWPTNPRELLEKEGLVPPLPKEGEGGQGT